MARGLKQSKALIEMTASMQARVAQQQASKVKRARPKEPKARPVQLDATPERLAKEPDAEMLAVKDEQTKAGTVMVRRFRSTHLDRLHKNGKLTYVQWLAGEWYRNQHDAGHPAPRVVAQYGHHVPGGEPSYGLARTEAQLRARQEWLLARGEWSRDQQGFMDRLLIKDELPRYGGRKAMRTIAFIRSALDELADYLRY